MPLPKRSDAVQTLLRSLQQDALPKHVAIIMDGNGRWAKKRHLPRVFGHKAGIQTVREIIQAASDIGIKHLTLYTFSSENWSRPATEVKALMKLLEQYLMKELPLLQKNNACLDAIGRWSDLPAAARASLERVMQATQTNTGLHVHLALNYGGRQEILDAFEKAQNAGCKKLTEASLQSFLYAPEVPDPDLLIRTSGEKRISNFLLWQMAYTEMYITDIHWPDFRPAHFYGALLDYQKRERRFGGIR